MTLLALGLVFLSALLHATWNLLTKRVSGGVLFVWLISALATILYAPVLVITALQQPLRLGPTQLFFLAGTCILHITYYILLNRGYKVGDLSLVYPLARGIGPMLATLGAVILLNERPSALALVGTILVGVGVFALTGNPRKLRDAGTQPAVLYGVLTGIVVAGYTLWDKQAVSAVLIAPILLNWISSLSRTVFLAPVALRHRSELTSIWRSFRRESLGVAILDPLSYILFLTALSFSPVSYLAPMRQLSILIGALMGTRLLTEGDASRRLTAVGAMTVGLVILALG
ncbi:MAG: EamA family transporter [Anaerolineae bacterium]|nr:EamA family transporter [Anaerolineae bacterium]